MENQPDDDEEEVDDTSGAVPGAVYDLLFIKILLGDVGSLRRELLWKKWVGVYL